MLALAVLSGEARVRGGLLLPRRCVASFRAASTAGRRLHVFAAGPSSPGPGPGACNRWPRCKRSGLGASGGGRRVRDAPMRGTGGSGRAARGDPSGGEKRKFGPSEEARGWGSGEFAESPGGQLRRGTHLELLERHRAVAVLVRDGELVRHELLVLGRVPGEDLQVLQKRGHLRLRRERNAGEVNGDVSVSDERITEGDGRRFPGRPRTRGARRQSRGARERRTRESLPPRASRCIRCRPYRTARSARRWTSRGSWRHLSWIGVHGERVAREPKPRSSRGLSLRSCAVARPRWRASRVVRVNTDRTVGGQLSRGAAQKRKFLVARPVGKNVTGEFHRAKTHPWWVHRKHHRSTDQLPSEAKRDFHLDPHIAGRHRSRPGQIPRVASHPPRRERFVVAVKKA